MEQKRAVLLNPETRSKFPVFFSLAARFISNDISEWSEDELNKLQRRDLNTKVFSEFAERFQYFAGFALLFLVLESVIRSRKNPVLKKYNLFKTEDK